MTLFGPLVGWGENTLPIPHLPSTPLASRPRRLARRLERVHPHYFTAVDTPVLVTVSSRTGVIHF